MRRRAWGGWRGVAGALVAAIFAVPLALMVSGSLRRPGEPPPKTLELLPDAVSLGSYGRAFDLVDLARHALNSLLVVAVAVPLTVLVASRRDVRADAADRVPPVAHPPALEDGVRRLAEFL